MKFGVSVLLLIAAYCAFEAYAGDIRFSELVIDGHVGNMNIMVWYKNKDTNGEFRRYDPPCPDKRDDDQPGYNEELDKCPDLNYDDDVELRISFDSSLLALPNVTTLSKDGDDTLLQPVKYKAEACFAHGFTNRRKWRKPKDIVQDDKRCSKELQEKTDLQPGLNNFTYKWDSDMPGAQFFVTVYIFCQVEGRPDDNQYCFFDTTGQLKDLAKPSDITKRLANRNQGGNADAILNSRQTSTELQYKTSVPDFRSTGLVVGVIVLSICSVSMLFGYFTFERLLKKTT